MPQGYTLLGASAPTLMPTLTLTPTPTPTRAFLLSSLIAGLAFAAGLACSSLLRPHALFNPLFTRLSPAASAADRAGVGTAGLPATAGQSSPLLPLGLQWYRAGHENPWQFSTLRAGIEDLDAAYARVMKRDGRMPRVVVSFTSLPRRFVKHAREMLRVLKQQSYLPDAVYVCIPLTSRRSGENFTVPAWLRDDPLVTVLRPRVDMGPATKLIPAVEAEVRLGNMRTRVVTVDDDNEGRWGKDTLLKLFAYSLRFEDAALGFTGWNVTCMVTNERCDPADSGVPERQTPAKRYNFVRAADDYACHSLFDWLPEYFANCLGAVRKNRAAFVDVLEGFKGVLYQPRFFDMAQLKSLMDEKKTPDYFFLCDDVWFSGWLGVRGVTRLVVNPAIHDDAPVRIKLVEASEKRKLPDKLLPLSSETESSVSEVRDEEVEEALHSMGVDFAKANYYGVRWFEKHGAWTPDMWKRPPGFVYASERNGSVEVGRGR